jgi:hypothetical protein
MEGVTCGSDRGIAPRKPPAAISIILSADPLAAVDAGVMDDGQLAMSPETYALQLAGNVALRKPVEPQHHPLRKCGDQRLRVLGTSQAAADQFAANRYQLKRAARGGCGAFLGDSQRTKPGAERPHRLTRNLFAPRLFDAELPRANLLRGPEA